MITADTILADVATKAEALDIARDRRATVTAVEKKHGAGSTTAMAFAASYDDLIDAIAEKFGKTVAAA